MAESKHRESRSDERTPVPDQYDAGYAARFRDEAMSVGATASWQAGWSDANCELGRFDEAFSPAQVPCRSSARERRQGGEVCPSIRPVPRLGNGAGWKRTSPWVWQALVDEVPPPWIALPGLDPWEPATHGLAEVYFDMNWLPFWWTLTQEQKAEYLDRWNASSQWREAIATLYEHEDIDLVEEGRLEAERRSKRQGREVKRPWWHFW